MKKLAVFILSVLMVSTFGTPVLANGDVAYETPVVEEENYVDPNWISVYNGNAIENQSKATMAYKKLSITKYYQNDYSDTMQTGGHTISAAGCALTSANMMINYLRGYNVNPSSFNSTMGNYADPFSWSYAASQCNVTFSASVLASSYGSTSAVYSELETQINNGYPVIVGLRLNSNSGSYSNHFVLVTGYNKNGTNYTFYINDPWSSGCSTLSGYTSGGYHIYRLITYTY